MFRRRRKGRTRKDYIDKGEQLSVATSTTGSVSRDTWEECQEVVMKAGSLEPSFEI